MSNALIVTAVTAESTAASEAGTLLLASAAVTA